MSEFTGSVTQWELDHVVDEITTLPPGHLAIIQVKTSIDRTRAHALLDQVPEAFKDRIMLLVGANEIFTVDEAVLLAAREAVRQEQRGRPAPRAIRDAPQA